MKILITGAAGQLGRELQRQLAAGGSALGPLPQRLELATVIPVDIDTADLSNRHDTAALLRHYAPYAVINCAAFTNVDKCETEPDTAFAANAVAARNVALACAEVDAKLVHVSTDYVFPGTATAPIAETAQTAPRSVYGATKLLGEEYVKAFSKKWFIARTAWLYGREGGNFVKTILRVGRERGGATVVDDQHGNPTNAEDLAHHLLQLVPTKEYGLYHMTGNGECSWYEFTKEIYRLWGLDAKVTPCSSEEYQRNVAPQAAPRPAYSALDNAMLRTTIGDGMRPWQEAIAHFYNEMKDEL